MKVLAALILANRLRHVLLTGAVISLVRLLIGEALEDIRQGGSHGADWGWPFLPKATRAGLSAWSDGLPGLSWSGEVLAAAVSLDVG